MWEGDGEGDPMPGADKALFEHLEKTGASRESLCPPPGTHSILKGTWPTTLPQSSSPPPHKPLPCSSS